METQDIPKLPPTANLSGTMYRIRQHEGLIVFTQDICVFGAHCRLSFERKCGCWYLSEISDTWGRVMVSHILKAYELLCETFGGNHVHPRGEHQP
jgi:hypothetical protein